MLAWDFFRHYLLSRRAGAVVRVVSWLCISGVGVAIFALVLTISIMNGFHDSYRSRLLKVEPHLVVKIPGVLGFAELVGDPRVQELQKSSDLEVTPFENQDVMVRTTEGLFGGGVASGVTSESLISTLNRIDEKKKKGVTSEQAAALLTEPGTVLIGVELARSLRILEGDSLTIIAPESLLLPAGEVPPFERVTVARIISTNVPDIDTKMIFYDRSKTLSLLRNSASRDAGIEVRLPDPYQFSDVQKDLVAKGFKVDSWRERNSALFFALTLEKLVMSTFLGLSALISSFSIVTVLILLLTKKRRDIGLLMALGMSQKKTQNLFLKIGLILAFIGLGSGMFLGVVSAWALDYFKPPLLPGDVYYDDKIPARVEFMFMVGVFLVASIVAYLSAWLPARWYTKLSPLGKK